MEIDLHWKCRDDGIYNDEIFERTNECMQQ